MDRGTTNIRSHSVLRSQELEVHAIFPSQALLEELAQPMYAIAFARAWNPHQTISYWLREFLDTVAIQFFCLLLTARYHFSKEFCLLRIWFFFTLAKDL